MDSPNSSRRGSCSAVASRRTPSTASSTRWGGMRLMRACSRAAGSNCTARLRAQSFAEIVASQPGIVGHHFTEAGPGEPAIDYWLKAGQQAARRSANAEALNHLARGLELLPNIDDPTLRNKSELLLQTSLGHSLRSIKGWSIDSVKHAYT